MAVRVPGGSVVVRVETARVITLLRLVLKVLR